MARPLTSSPDPTSRQERVLGTLLQLYSEERRIYEQVLALSRQQGELIRSGGRIQELRRILEHKRDRLDTIAQMEAESSDARSFWDTDRQSWSATAQGQLHQVLRQVGSVIEQVLLCEEGNDRWLLEQTKAT